MRRAVITAGFLFIASALSGCCHLWENIHYWEDCMFCECGHCDIQGCNWGWGDYGSAHAGCSGCGGCYYGEWHMDTGCDPCDCHGNWVGPGYVGSHHSHGVPYTASRQGGVVQDRPLQAHQQVPQQQERSAIVAEQPDHTHAIPKRLR
ncbi:MAG: hypothetical protein MPJ50_08580 [Pirellulales bacterium]|nr:hypothetical protein [Pirellulales bacterium]